MLVKKCIGIICCLPGIFSLSFGAVTYMVKVPPDTHDCFIAGAMNGWIPHEMNRINATTYRITIEEAKATDQYKYCSGPNWDYVEKKASGEDIANRQYKTNDKVEAWVKVWNPAMEVLPKVAFGRLKRIFFTSKYVDARNIDVWLPEGYDSTRRYDVLYMQDGQMLFDSDKTWNGQDWQVAETLHRLIREDSIKKTIVVGIWNDGNKRIAEYYPQKAFESIAAPYKDSLLAWMPGGPVGDEYLKFLVTELKPFVDTTFPVFTDQQHTFIMGSSYGGLISLYAICEYPQVFAGAACMSTHWIGLFYPNDAIPAAIDKYLDTHLPTPSSHRIYFDYGSKGFDQYYQPYQQKVNALMKIHGYTRTNWITRYFPGMDHSEKSWAARLNFPLIFLLSK